MSSGKIVQIIGAVIDVEFPRESVPQVYDALNVEGKPIVLEVQQQLGDGIVRTIAMGSTEGVSRFASDEHAQCDFRPCRNRNPRPYHGCLG